jgi:hypothetical protein
VPACNRDWSSSAFAPVRQIYCTGDVVYGIGKKIELTLIYNGTQLLDTTPVPIDTYDWYFDLFYVTNPLILPGDYVCQVKLDGQVAAERPFTITQ